MPLLLAGSHFEVSTFIHLTVDHILVQLIAPLPLGCCLGPTEQVSLRQFMHGMTYVQHGLTALNWPLKLPCISLLISITASSE